MAAPASHNRKSQPAVGTTSRVVGSYTKGGQKKKLYGNGRTVEGFPGSDNEAVKRHLNSLSQRGIISDLQLSF